MDKARELLKERISFCEVYISNCKVYTSNIIFKKALEDFHKGLSISYKIELNEYSKEDIDFMKNCIDDYFSDILKECRRGLQYVDEKNVKKTEDYMRLVNDARLEILLLRYSKN